MVAERPYSWLTRGKTDVLGHPFSGKPGLEVSRKDVGSLEGDQAALGRAVVQNLQHELGGNATLSSQNHSLRESLHEVGEDKILCQLRLKALARRAAIVEHLPHDFEIWLGFVKGSAIAADHESERSFFRARRGSGAGSVQKLSAPGGERLADLLADRRRYGTAIGGDTPRPNALEQTVGPASHGLRHGAIAHAVEDEVGTLGHLSRSRAGNGVPLLGELLRLVPLIRPQ